MKEKGGITLSTLVLLSAVCQLMASTCYSSLHRLNAVYGFAYYVSSYNYPLNYNPNQNCYWYIAAPSSSMVIKATFVDFNLQYSSTCSTDAVELRDGSSYYSTYISRFCGTKRPPVIISKGRYLYVKFHSDSTFQYRGFKLAFTAVYPATQVSGKCSSSYSFAANNNIQLTSERGTIMSPNYPSYYPTNMQCTWKISVPSGKTIKLTFDYMSVESYSFCTNDYLQVRDGHSSTSSKKGDYCGTTRRTIYSSGQYLWLRFRSNHQYTYKGFQLTYSVRESTDSSHSSVGLIIGVLVAIAVVFGIIVCVVHSMKKSNHRSRGVVHNAAASVVTTSTVSTASGSAPVQGQYPQKGQPYPGSPPQGQPIPYPGGQPIPYPGPPPQGHLNPYPNPYPGPPPQGQPNPYPEPPPQGYPNSYPGPPLSGQPNPYPGPIQQGQSNPYQGPPLSGQPYPYPGEALPGQTNSYPGPPPPGYPNTTPGAAHPYPYPAAIGGPPVVSM